MEAYELRRMRRAHGLTTDQLAALLGVSATAVERWEAPVTEGGQPIEPRVRRRILREFAHVRNRRLTAVPPRMMPASFTPSFRQLVFSEPAA